MRKKTCLVWVLQYKIFAVRETHAIIHNATYYSPAIIHAQVHLTCQLAWSKLLSPQDTVLR